MHASLALKADISLEQNKRVCVRIFDNVILEAQDIWNIHNHTQQLLTRKRHTVLVVAGEFSSISKDALQAAADNNICENKIAEAIVINSLAQRLLANFFIRTHKPISHTRVFDSLEEAKRWLDGIERDLLPNNAS
jgi:hypothetical protein